MCGLLGVLSAGGDAGERVADVGAALRCARHRGPDEAGTWHDADVVLALNRLAIVDVASSHQPLRWGPPDQPDRYVIVFNGEVYNHPELREQLRGLGAKFATEGDTEVIVAAYHHWGAAAVAKLRGMFAFLVWDTHRRELFGARDPFGIKPLYYVTSPAGTAFASERKSLRALAAAGTAPDSAVDTVALQHYLLLQYVPEPATLHRDVRRVESGCHITMRPGGEVEQERYFVPDLRSRPAPDPDALHKQIAEALRDSVAKHLRADVTVGAFLSGGIDSTAIAALAHEHDPNLVTFTTGFQREGYSEVDVAAETAAAIGVRHVVRTVSAEEVMETLPLIVWYLDDPVADPALVPLWFIAREARKHIKVVLSGEGADELFGGYAIYREPISLSMFERVPGVLRALLGRASTRLPEGMRGKDLLRRGSLSLEQRYYGNARIFRDDQLAAVLRRYDPRRSHTDITCAHYRDSLGWDPVARMQHVDLFTWLRGDILVKADAMTMANSLELRVPFLDPEVFAVASKLPVEQKIGKDSQGRSTTKHALRRALAEIVPPHVLDRPKLGFPVPIRHWLRAEMHDWARDIVRDSQADHLVDLDAVEAIIEAHRQGPVDHSRRIWALLVFLLWHGIVVEGRITPEVPEPSYPVMPSIGL